jgi:hypothetical protein
MSMVQSPGFFHLSVFAILAAHTSHTSFQFMGDLTFGGKTRVNNAG